MSKSTYDELPYLGFPRRHAHPSVIGATARIFGIEAPPVSTARILELGCGDGANILSIAAGLPDASCCGVDSSGIQIDRGQAAAQQAGIDNIRLIQADFVSADYPEENYDYIIAHGVYSWITSEEQDEMLQLIRRRLSSQGVAFISYNCFPGWNFRKLTRDIMLYQTRKLNGQQEKVDMARQVLPVIGEAIPQGIGGYAALVRDEQKLVDGTGDYYIAHEHLEEDNQPCYFHEFAERLDGNELQYLCEAEMSSMFINRYPAPLVRLQQEPPGTMAARIEAEQLLDYAVLRMFRQSLVVAKGHDGSSSISSSVVEGLWASAFGDFPDDPVFSNQSETFTSAKGIGINTSSAVAKAALFVLAKRWPERVAFDDLLEGAMALVPETGDEEARGAVAELLLAACSTDGVELHADRGMFTGEVPDKPRVSALARYQANQEKTAFTLRHLIYDVDGFARFLLPKLDGSLDFEGILSLILQGLESGELTLPPEVPVPDDPTEREAFIRQQLPGTLEGMANAGLFVREA